MQDSKQKYLYTKVCKLIFIGTKGEIGDNAQRLPFWDILITILIYLQKITPLMISMDINYITYKDLTIDNQRLLDAAEEAMANAYNPYSNFFVGAALRAYPGLMVKGANVENAAYGSTICAERSALVRANAMGIREIEAIAIIGKGLNFDSKEIVAPCGSCRQMLFEAGQVGGRTLEVIMSNTRKDKILIATINELLPLAFGPKDLGLDIERFRH